jgi:hypothetical protein
MSIYIRTLITCAMFVLVFAGSIRLLEALKAGLRADFQVLPAHPGNAFIETKFVSCCTQATHVMVQVLG